LAGAAAGFAVAVGFLASAIVLSIWVLCRVINIILGGFRALWRLRCRFSLPGSDAALQQSPEYKPCPGLSSRTHGALHKNLSFL